MHAPIAAEPMLSYLQAIDTQQNPVPVLLLAGAILAVLSFVAASLRRRDERERRPPPRR